MERSFVDQSRLARRTIGRLRVEVAGMIQQTEPTRPEVAEQLRAADEALKAADHNLEKANLDWQFGPRRTHELPAL